MLRYNTYKNFIKTYSSVILNFHILFIKRLKSEKTFKTPYD